MRDPIARAAAPPPDARTNTTWKEILQDIRHYIMHLYMHRQHVTLTTHPTKRAKSHVTRNVISYPRTINELTNGSYLMVNTK